MSRRPTRRDVEEQDRYELVRHATFRRAADAVTTAFVAVPEVRAVALFGSVARPLERELSHFPHFRRFGIETLHYCKDVDLAVQIDRLDNLAALNKARGAAVATVHASGGPGVAHHQVDIFLFGSGWGDYLGRLCSYGQCPKGKRECYVPGCGSEPLLRQHAGFVLQPDALAPERCILLYERDCGILRRAAEIDDAGSRGPEAKPQAATRRNGR